MTEEEMDQGTQRAEQPGRRIASTDPKIMGRFKSPAQAQRFLAAHDQINTML